MRPELKMTKIDDVECFCSENKRNYLHIFDNRDYLLDLTLKQLESEIDPKDFYRVSIKFIVTIKGNDSNAQQLASQDHFTDF